MRNKELFSLNRLNEVPLEGGPLKQVVTQIQHSQTAELVSEAGEAAIAAELLEYPVRRRINNIGVSPTGQTVEQIGRTLSDVAGSWVVTLTENSISLQTTDYSSRDDFCSRAQSIFDAVQRVAPPPVVDRVGLRYINRIEESDFGKLDDYLNPRLMVLANATGDGMTLRHSISESLIELEPDDQLQIRTGMLPPGAAFTPGVEGSEGVSWTLDMDVFSGASPIYFQPDGLVRLLRRYSEHAYSFFRWATTESLHDRYRREG